MNMPYIYLKMPSLITSANEEKWQIIFAASSKSEKQLVLLAV